MNIRNSTIIISTYLLHTVENRKSYYSLLKDINDSKVLIPSVFTKDFFINIMMFVVAGYQFSASDEGTFLIPKTAIEDTMSELLNMKVWFDKYDNLKCDDCNSIREKVFTDDFWFKFIKRIIQKYPQLVDDIGKSLMSESVQIYFGLGKKNILLKNILSDAFISSLPDKYKELIMIGEEVDKYILSLHK